MRPFYPKGAPPRNQHESTCNQHEWRPPVPTRGAPTIDDLDFSLARPFTLLRCVSVSKRAKGCGWNCGRDDGQNDTNRDNLDDPKTSGDILATFFGLPK